MSLSNALHGRNMSLMVDIVLNHLAANATPDAVDYNLFPSPLNSPQSFHPNCTIDYANQSSIEDCWLVDSPPPTLPDIKSEDATVFNAMIASVVKIVQNYDVDGIRLDTARHIPKQYLAQFQDAVGVFVTGEALNDSVAYVSQYQGPLDSAINYPLWFVLVDTFAGRTTFDYLAATIKAEEAVFPDVNALTIFLDNHDQPRMASRLGDDVVRDMNAVTFLLFTSGIPIVYYGFEQRFNGSGDPINREPMWTSNYDTNATLYKYIATLHEIRAVAASAMGKSGYFASTTKVLGTSSEYMAFQRGPLVVVVSNVGGQGSVIEPAYEVEAGIAIQTSQFAAGASIVDLLSCQKATVGSQGTFNSPSNGGQARLWIQESAKGPLCK